MRQRSTEKHEVDVASEARELLISASQRNKMEGSRERGRKRG
jgi:hypothetical protein